jgi:excisionase family DNA binding protein
MKKLTAKQAAEKLNVNDSRIRQLINSGKLPAEKYGNLWLIDEKDLELVKDRKPTGRPPKAKEKAK